jgi:hypothetical protein
MVLSRIYLINAFKIKIKLSIFVIRGVKLLASVDISTRAPWITQNEQEEEEEDIYVYNPRSDSSQPYSLLRILYPIRTTRYMKQV